MIAFVYCCMCLLIVCCQTTKNEYEDNVYNNDSPVIAPKMNFHRYKIGTNITLKCSNNRKENITNITWEFKNCTNYKRFHQSCKENMYKLGNDNEWKKLDFGKNKKKLEIINATEENNGFYRCLDHNSVVIKIYSINVVVPIYNGPPPNVISLISPNSTVFPNTPLVIQCKVSSVEPPEIRWFKECDERKYDIKENDHYYCSISFIPSSNFVYTSNDTYISKLHIHKSRNIDSGVYLCLAISIYGTGYKNITIKVQDFHNDEMTNKSFPLLFLIPLCFILVPVTIWLCFYCFYKRKKKNQRILSEQQKQLIKPVVKLI